MLANLISFAIGVARVVDPSGAVAIDGTINDMVFIDVKVKRMVGLEGIVWVTILGFLPGNHVALVFNDDLTFRNVHERKDALAVYARASGLDAI